MGKQNKSKRTGSLGKGEVTPVQIAFIVDRYLSDNNLSETRSVFRTEASTLISKSPVREAPKSLLSLEAILNEYICLKEQKVMLDQERVRLEQEKLRVQNLLHGMQEVMNGYNASGNIAAVASTHMIQASLTKPVAMVPLADPFRGSPAGCPMYQAATGFPVSTPSSTTVEHSNPSSITPHTFTRKRMGSNVVAEPVPVAKKSRSKSVSRKISCNSNKQSDNDATTQENAQPSPVVESSTQNFTPAGPTVQGSNVAKSLLDQPLPSPPTSSSNPNTPPQGFSTHDIKSVSPRGISGNARCSSNNTPQQVTPTTCTVITTSERLIVSPLKSTACYTMERNKSISSPSPIKSTFTRLYKRDCVKGRLDFDGSDATVNLDKPAANEFSTSGSDKEADIFDLDLPNLDAFGANFSFSELLVDLDLGYEGIACPCQPALAASTDTFSGSSHESRDGNLGADQVMSEFSSTMIEVISGKDMQIQGPDMAAVKSITKCIKILSPVKTRRS